MKITVPSDRITSGSWGAERTFDRVTGLEPVSLWEPLRSPDHVRLLLLYPPGWPHRNSSPVRHQDDTKIQCRLFQVQLGELSTTGRPKFAALSYAWGSTKKPRQILCNNTQVQVTENLYHALKWIRLPTRPRLVWNDFLCIHQTNSDEKSAQVARMGQIFGQAHVISYIGGSKDPEHAETCLAVVRRLALVADRIFERQYERDDLIFLSRTMYGQHLPPSLPDWKSAPWDMIFDLTNEEYFNRLWIFQEVRLARSHTCQWGRHFCSMHQLNEAGRLMSFGLEHPMGMGLSSPREYDVRTGWQRIQIMSGDPVLFNPYPEQWRDFRIVGRSTVLGCKDPKDRIYGLASLFQGSKDYVVDYSLSISEVYTGFIFHLIARNGTNIPLIPIFGAAHNRSIYRNPDEYARETGWTWTSRLLPSWCPDFGVGGPRGSDPARAPYYRGPFGQNQQLPAHVFPVSPRVLSVRGVRCANIAACANHKRSDINPQDFVVKSGRLALRLLTGKPSNQIFAEFLDVLRQGGHWVDRRRWPTHPFLLDTVHSSFDFWSEVTPNHYWSTLESFAPYYLEKHARNLFSLDGTTAPRDMTTFTNQHSAFIREMEEEAYDSVRSTRRCFITSSTPPLGARFACGSDAVRVGDKVFVAYGEGSPLVVRRVGKEGYYKFVGNCYLNGLMEGEAPHLGLPEEDLLLI